MEQKFMIFGLAIGALIILALFYGANLGQAASGLGLNKSIATIVTPFAVDAWGSLGWGSCADSDGGTARYDAYCKCKGYIWGVSNNGANSCYKESVADRYKWTVGSSYSGCAQKGAATYAGYGVTTVRCWATNSSIGGVGPINLNGTIVLTPFPVDAWGSTGWGNCTTGGGLSNVLAFCKCKGFKGVYNNGTGACYEEWKNQRWTWTINTTVIVNDNYPCAVKGTATNQGLAITQVKCI